MKNKSIVVLMTLLVAFSILMASCAAPTPEVVTVQETVVVEKEVVETVVVEKEVMVEPEGEFDYVAALKGKKLASILSGPVNDGGWNTNAYLGLINARDKFQMDIAYTESVKVEDAEQILRDYAEAGYDIVMAHGYEYADQIAAVAREYPDVKFIQTNGAEGGIDNLYTVTLSAGEGGYFMGRLACELTKTKKIQWIIAEQFPIMDHHVLMAKQACEDLGMTDIEWSESYVGSWGDPAKVKELTKAALEQGADILITVADAGDPGAIEAIQEEYDKGNTDIYYISWSKDRNNLAPEFAIGGWEEMVDQEVEYVLKQIAEGNPGGHFSIGLLEGANRINPFYGLVPAEVEQDIVDLERQYLDDPASIPNLVVRTDL